MAKAVDMAFPRLFNPIFYRHGSFSWKKIGFVVLLCNIVKISRLANVFLGVYKKKILNNRTIIKDFFGVTSGIRTHDIQNHKVLEISLYPLIIS